MITEVTISVLPKIEWQGSTKKNCSEFLLFSRFTAVRSARNVFVAGMPVSAFPLPFWDPCHNRCRVLRVPRWDARANNLALAILREFLSLCPQVEKVSQLFLWPVVHAMSAAVGGESGFMRMSSGCSPGQQKRKIRAPDCPARALKSPDRR